MNKRIPSGAVTNGSGSPSRRALVLVLVAFAVTRVINVPLALDDSTIAVSFADLEKYQQWSQAAMTDGSRPYQDIPIEYPPGVLPFIVAPRVVTDADTPYSTPFALLMLVLDMASFGVLLLLAQRWGSVLGAWVWVLGVFLIGPIVYLRLDLIPAAATVIALERSAAGNRSGSAGWMGFGAAAKVYPAFLLPAMAAVAPKPWRALGWSLGVVAAVVLPTVVIGGGPELWHNVVGYHGDRGIHVESTWGFLLLAASKLGREMTVNYQFGANEALSSFVGPMKAIGTGLSMGTLVLSFVVARARVARGDAYGLAIVAFGTLALLMGVGTVFSPQYMVWLAALGGVVACKKVERGRARPDAGQNGPKWTNLCALSVVPAAALTQLVYPRTINDVLAPFYEGSLEAGSTAGVVVLGVRNLFVLGLGAVTLWMLWRQGRSARRTPGTEEREVDSGLR